VSVVKLGTGPSPVDRGRLGSKHHLIVDQTGIPLVDRIPAVRGIIGRPRRRPDQLIADRGYDSQSHRRQLRQRGITPKIARRETAHGSGLGRYRWVVERTFAWLHQFRRLLVRYDRRADIHEGFLAIGCCLICWRRLSETTK